MLGDCQAVYKYFADYSIRYTTRSYGDTLGSINILGAGSAIPGTFAWTAGGSALVGNAPAQTHNMTFTLNANTPNYNAITQDLTVTIGKAAGTFVPIGTQNITYYNGLMLSGILLPPEYTWVNPSTTLNAADGQIFQATYTDPSGNFETATGIITVNVAKATIGSFGNPSEINTTFTTGLTLADISLPAGYAWVNPATPLNAGRDQTFAATYTNPNGNFEPINGSIRVNVAEAPITSAAIHITAPVKGETPNATATGTGDFTIGIVTWRDNLSNTPTVFLGSTVYTATVILTAEPNYTFPAGFSATIDGQLATSIAGHPGNDVDIPIPTDK